MMKPPLWVAEAGIWKDAFPLAVLMMVVIGVDTMGSHLSELSEVLLILPERRRHNTPEKQIKSDKLAHYRNFWFEELPVPRGRNKKII